MGACQSRQPSQFYKRIPKDQEDAFWINKIQIHYFRERVKSIELEAETYFKQKQSEVMTKIKQTQEEVQKRFKAEAEKFSREFPNEYKRLGRDNDNVMKELGWERVSQQFEQLKQETINILEAVKDQKNSNFLKFYKKIQAQLIQKEKQVPLNVYLCQETVQSIYQAWKVTHQQQIQDAKDAIDSQLNRRDQRPEYYNKKFAAALDLAQLQKLAKKNPLPPGVIEEEEQTNYTFCKLFSFPF